MGFKKSQMDKFHFMAMGGIGQSALAKILLEQGFEVTGSDIHNSKYLDILKKLGAKVFIGHDKSNVQKGFKVVVSTAIKENNPEFVEAKKLGLEILHRSDLLKILSENSKSFIGFSGTHGKTTTSGLCAYVLEKMGENPSFAIGGIIPEIDTNAKSSKDYKNRFFIAELDESDGTISKYKPDFWVVNNLELDHHEFYKNGLPELIDTFNKTAKNLDNSAKIFLNIDDLGNLDFLKKIQTKAKILTFSLKNDANYVAKNIKYEKKFTTFDIFKKDCFLGNLKISILGEHNVYNALSVVAVLIEAGFDFEKIKPYFKTFTGMGRRFEHICEFNGIEIIDDYSHHPTEIKYALKTLRNYTKGNIVAVFQPHRYTRFKGLFEEFKKSFDNCDTLYVVEVYSFGDEIIEEYKSEHFVEQIEHKNCRYVKGSIEEVAKQIFPSLKKGDTLITIGAGDITDLPKFLEREYERTL